MVGRLSSRPLQFFPQSAGWHPKQKATNKQSPKRRQLLYYCIVFSWYYLCLNAAIVSI